MILIRSLKKYYSSIFLKFVVFIVFNYTPNSQKVKDLDLKVFKQKLYTLRNFVFFVYRLSFILLFIHVVGLCIFLAVSCMYIDCSLYSKYIQYNFNSISFDSINYTQFLLVLVDVLEHSNFCLYKMFLKSVDHAHLETLINFNFNDFNSCLYKIFVYLNNKFVLVCITFTLVFIAQLLSIVLVLLDYKKYIKALSCVYIPTNSGTLVSILGYIKYFTTSINISLKLLNTAFRNKIKFISNSFYNNIYLETSFKLYRFNILKKLDLPSLFFFWKPTSKRTPYFRNIKKN